MFADGWVGIDLTRLARRGLMRGEQTLQIYKLVRGRYDSKYAFIEIRNRDYTEVW